MAKKFEYYEIRKLLKAYPNAHYYVVIGERSNGKTYSALDYAVERYAKTGEQFAYVRRFAEDIRKKHMSSLFSGHIENGEIERLTNGQWSSVEFGTSKFSLTKYVDDQKVVSEEPMGFTFDLNSMEHYKSTSFPKITTIIFDEFMSRSGYLPNEWILFSNTLSTIIRLRSNVKIIMLGNTVNKYCPYFVEMGLNHVKDQKQGTIDVYHYGDTDLQVVCEYTGSAVKSGGKPSDVYFAFDNPELQMITSGSWEIALYPHLSMKILPKDVVGNFFIVFNDELLHAEIIAKDTGPFIFIHNKTTPIKDEDKDLIYSDKPDERWNHRMCLTKQGDKFSLFIQKCIKENRIFYSTNEVGEIFRNYLMWSDSFSIKN